MGHIAATVPASGHATPGPRPHTDSIIIQPHLQQAPAGCREVAKAPGLGWPLRFEPPALQRLLPEEARSASFRVTVLTDTLRVTRGDRGELRVYVADHSALPAAGGADIPDPDTNTTFS